MQLRIKTQTCIIAIFFLCFFYGVGCTAAKANQCIIVKIGEEIKGDTRQIWLYPQKLTVSRGDCIIWANFTERYKVSITFHGNGKSCLLASEMSSGFTAVNSCFFSDFLLRGQTVSLMFKEIGVFEYQLEIPTKEKDNSWGYHGKIVRKGTIVVE